MGLRELLQSRCDAVELGHGVWRRAHDRFRRGVDRFHQILERMNRSSSVEELVPFANRLSELLPEVRRIAVEAHRLAPSESTDIPASPEGGCAEVHRALSTAGNSLAQCAEALAMLRCGGADRGGAYAPGDSVERRVAAVEEQVAQAARRLNAARADGFPQGSVYAAD